VILADDLGMGAVAKQWPAGEAAIQTFRAGSDMALLCHDWKLVQPALEGVAAAYAAGKFDDREWKASRKRMASLRKSLEIPGENMLPLSIIGCAEHRAIVQEIRERQRKMLS
jgi:beta-N-acetylhexosaminidase